jgi:RimJ/RimL family protein N-acetyltransferase
MDEVETARLLLRRWRDGDAERLVALYADPLVSRYLSLDGRPWPRERADNLASRRVMEKCGLVLQEEFPYKGGTAVWYALDRAEWQARKELAAAAGGAA